VPGRLCRDADKVVAAAGFASSYRSQLVRLRVLRVSPFLSSLAVDSRAWAADHAGARLVTPTT
jgi:hypothetical protein